MTCSGGHFPTHRMYDRPETDRTCLFAFRIFKLEASLGLSGKPPIINQTFQKQKYIGNRRLQCRQLHARVSPGSFSWAAPTSCSRMASGCPPALADQVHPRLDSAMFKIAMSDVAIGYNGVSTCFNRVVV